MAFSYVSAERVAVFLDGAVTGQREQRLTATVEMLSARLSAWFPTLRETWERSAPDSELRSLVEAMITDTAQKIANNPKGMSSETLGPFAYSRFDSEDTSKNLFLRADLDALERLLAGLNNKKSMSIRVKSSKYMKSFAPTAVNSRPVMNTYRRYRR